MKNCLLLSVIGLLYPILSFTQSVEPDYHFDLPEPQFRFHFPLDQEETDVRVCGLEPGIKYSVRISAPGLDACETVLRLSGEKGDFKSAKNFTAEQACTDFKILAKCKFTKEIQAWLAVNKHDKTPEVEKSLMGINTSVNSNTHSLIADVFIGGDCFDVTGVAHRGAGLARGTFNGGGSSIGIEEGIIISTGGISNAEGPNTMTGRTTDLGTGGDPDLATIGGGQVFDAAVIEFDFVPTVGVVTFEYVFASEEYCDYVGSQFNDVFGFFISGPGITGPYSNNSVNIAALPDGTPVAINNVNYTSNAAFYVDNVPVGQAQGSGGCTAAELNNNGLYINETEFDGFTTVLTAVANVQPCETYHIKLAIADVNDGLFDSAVFLKANSFNAGGTILASSGITGIGSSENTAYEGCGDGFFVFERAGDDFSEAIDVTFNISGQSTATPGLDYVAFPNTITIPAGESSYTLNISIIQDLFPEGIESIILEISNSCSCTSSTIELFIEDPPPLLVQAPPMLVCEGSSATIIPDVSGGIPGYSYFWNDGSSSSSLNITPNGPGIYSVTVSDNCGQVSFANIQVETFSPTAELSGEASLCEGSGVAELEVFFTGPAPWEITYQVGGFTNTVSNIFQNPYLLQADLPGTYQLLSVSAMGCPGEASGMAQVDIIEVMAELEVHHITCFGQANGAINLEVNTGIPPFTFDWNQGFSDQEDLSDLTEGDYEVLITDSLGCTATLSTAIEQPPALELHVVSITDIDCTNPDDGSIDIQINGGQMPYEIDWSNGTAGEDATGLGGGTYSVQITDSLGCAIDSSFTVEDYIAIPQVEAIVEDTLNCNNATVFINGGNSSNGANFSYQWLDESGQPIPGETNNTLNVDQAGNYTLVVLDNDNSCSDSLTMTVEEDFSTPNAEAGLPDTLTCTVQNLSLDASASDTTNMILTWNSANGNILSGENTPFPIVDEAGIYTLEITSTTNGCSASDQVEIFEDLTTPEAQIAPVDGIDCYTPEVELSSLGSSEGPEFSYLWTGLEGQNIPDSTEPSTTVNEGGNYQLLVTNNQNGCTAQASVEIAENTIIPVANAGFLLELSCATGTTFLEGTGSSTGGQYTYLWSTTEGNFLGDSTQLMNEVNQPGYYNLLVTDTLNGCSALDSVLVTENTNAPEAEASAQGLLTCTATALQLDGTGSDFGQGFEIQWISPQGYPIIDDQTLNPTISQPGTYVIQVTDLTNSCQSIASVTVNQDITPPQAEAGPGTTLTCYAPVYQLDGSQSDQGSVYQVSWSTENGDPNLNPTAIQPQINQAGNYTITVLNTENGCSSSDQVEILANQQAPIADAGPDSALNCAVESIVIQSGNSSAGPNFDFEWIGLEGQAVFFNELQPEVSEPAVFQLHITDLNNGCSASDTVAITLDTLAPIAAISAPDMLNCNQPQITLNAEASSSGNQFDYQWSTQNGNILIDSSDLLHPIVDAAGIYWLLVANTDNFCIDSVEVSVAEDFEPPIAQIEPVEELTCTISEIELNASASSSGSNFEYQWTGPDSYNIQNANSLMPTISGPGIYELSIINTENGCTASTDVEVFQDPDIPIVLIATPPRLTCDLQSIQLDASGSTTGSNISYFWHSDDGNILYGADGISPTVNAAGNYQIEITNLDNNCIAINSIQVEIDTLAPTAQAHVNGILNCTQTSLQLDGSGSSEGAIYTYYWSSEDGLPITNANSLAPTIQSAGVYQLLVENTQNGCTDADQVAVNIDTLAPVLVLEVPGWLTCETETVTLSATAMGNAPLEYLWTTQIGHILDGENSLSPTVDEAGFYQLEVTNLGNGCINQGAVEVPIDTISPVADAGMDAVLNCEVESLILSGEATGNGPLEYLWTTEEGNILYDANSLNPQINAPGIYVLEVRDLNNGCITFDAIEIGIDEEAPLAQITEPEQLTCSRLSVVLNGISNEGSTPFEFTWMDESGNILGLDNPQSIEVNEPGWYQLSVLNPENGCTTTTAAIVTQNIQMPIADAGQSAELHCMQTEVMLDAGGSSTGNQFSYNWSTDNGQIIAAANSLNPVVNSPGIYQLEVWNQENDCRSTDWVEVLENLPVAAEVNPAFPPCFGDLGSIEVLGVNGGQAPYFYSIDGGDIFQNDPLFPELVPGLYQILVQDANGCEIEQQVAIEEPAEVEVDLDVQTTIRFGDSIQLYPHFNILESEIASVQWTPAVGLSCSDCLYPWASPDHTEEYRVRIVNDKGCEDDAIIRLIVDRRPAVYIPNAFSPNGDDNNDVFVIYAKDNTVEKVNSLMIFNRWGELVYDVYNFPPNDPTFGWDGTHRGEALNPAVFVYWTELELIDGTTVLFKGDVALVR